MPRIKDVVDVLRCEKTATAVQRQEDAAMARLSAGGDHRERTPDGRTVYPFVSGGRWVADCINEECRSAMNVAPWLPEATCVGCGHVYKPEFPKPAEIDAADAILHARPDPKSRNWHPHKGEKVKDLVEENERFTGIGVAEEHRANEPSELEFKVRAAFDDGHDGARFLEDSLAEQLRDHRLLPRGGYVIAHDDYPAPENNFTPSGLAVVRVIGQPPKKVAELRDALGGEES